MKNRLTATATALLLCLLASIPSFAADVFRTPQPFPDGMDTWFGTVYNTSSQYGTYRLRVGGWGDYYYTLLRFNLSGLPLDATSAKIWLLPFNDGGTPTPISVDAIGAQWNTSTVTKYNFPFSSRVGLFTETAPTYGQWYSIDITNEYNAWRTSSGTLNYGLMLEPVYNNNNYSSFYSSSGPSGDEPYLQITYTPQANDNVLKLKWPLGQNNPNHQLSGYAFGDAWLPGQAYCVGQPMTHAGIDIAANAGEPVYAAEDGVVKEIHDDATWAYDIVTEHTSPSGEKYTIVYWHVNPVGSISTADGRDFVPKGMEIATVADLGNDTHLHLGIRMGAYNSTYSDKGALPTGSCSELATFPENFINPLDTSLVSFQ